MKYCGKCHKEWPDHYQICPLCGEKFTRICPHCGDNLDDLPNDARFCPKCGQELRNEKEEERKKEESRIKERQMYNSCSTIADYQSYLTNYSNGEFRYEAIAAIRKMQDEEKRKEDERNRINAAKQKERDMFLRSSTIMEYRKYLSEYPYGEWTTEAKNSILYLESKLRLEEDDFYKKCKASGDYNSYIVRYPNGRYTNEAMKNREAYRETVKSPSSSNNTVQVKRSENLFFNNAIANALAYIIGVPFGIALFAGAAFSCLVLYDYSVFLFWLLAIIIGVVSVILLINDKEEWVGLLFTALILVLAIVALIIVCNM